MPILASTRVGGRIVAAEMVSRLVRFSGVWANAALIGESSGLVRWHYYRTGSSLNDRTNTLAGACSD